MDKGNILLFPRKMAWGRLLKDVQTQEEGARDSELKDFFIITRCMNEEAHEEGGE